jgi:hypothetical protein
MGATVRYTAVPAISSVAIGSFRAREIAACCGFCQLIIARSPPGFWSWFEGAALLGLFGG